MSRGSKRAERLIKIQNKLVVGAYSALELAELFGVDDSTIRRDFHLLEEEGITLKQVGNDRYRIDSAAYLHPVRLSSGESLMLYLAMRLFMRRLTRVPDVMTSAFEKISQALGHPLSHQLAEMAGDLRHSRPAEPERAAVWGNLIRGWHEQITVRFTYQKFDQPDVTEYEVDPYFFEPASLSEGVYLIGYSHTHKQIRTFKVERMQRVLLTTQQFSRPEYLNVGTLLEHAWGVWYGKEQEQVVLRFSAPNIVRRVCESRWHPSQHIEAQADGSILWSVQVAGITELIPWIRGWGADVEVLAPDHLRRTIAAEMRRAAALYEEVET